MDQNQPQQHNNSPSDDISEQQNPESENLIPENLTDEIKTDSVEQKPQETLPVTEKREKIPTKLHFSA
ncbi:hypothetical protein [Chryseobacterium indoltheticum]|uniref:hypothetical protein n=1 Tax=Chryseobacterium indoltheticum TaxID=254 RepID=UPI003F4966CC